MRPQPAHWVTRLVSKDPLSADDISRLQRIFHKYSARISANRPLGQQIRKVVATGRPFVATYLLLANQLYFDPAGNEFISYSDHQERSRLIHKGGLNVIPHPDKPAKAIFIFDCAPWPPTAPNTKPGQRGAPAPHSINEHFMFLYALLLKSGAGIFSVRFAPSGEKANEVNGVNLNKTSQLLFPDEEREDNFISNIRQVIQK